MSKPVSTSIEHRVGILVANSPPVNALGHAVRRGILECFDLLADDANVSAIVIVCDGRTFFAGADISELGQPSQEPGFNQLFNRIDASTKPVVAAIHGTALGGGLELALACHFRVAVPSAKLGLPEVQLGILPGAGGTQRLPRLVGVQTALDLITSGRSISAQEALDIGLVDAVTDEALLRQHAVAFARRVVDEKKPLVRVRNLEEKLAEARKDPSIFSRFRAANARAFRGFKAPEAIIQSIEAAVELPFDKGLARETELFLKLVDGRESAAQRYAFFAERDALKIPDVPADTATLRIDTVGVIGAGTMGGGITMSFVSAGVPVILAEVNQEALDRGLNVIRKNYEASARKGRLTSEQVERCMSLITPVVGLQGLSSVDLIIEAVFESMPVKKDIFARLDQIAKPQAILASNTSFLDLNEIATATQRPEQVVGLHFFSPANVMKLLEVVRGERTSQSVIATAMKLAKRIGKKPVLSRVCYGFIANRLMDPRLRQAEALVLEGPTPSDIDRVIRDYGFAMGPFQMIDLVGLDVIDRDERARSLRSDLVNLGRLGQKKNGGFYDYDERRNANPSAVAAKVIADFAAFKGVANTGQYSDDDILARLLYPVVNEGAKILQEGIALRASDIDLAAVLGYGWPVYTGGPMFWANTVGLPKIVAGLRRLEEKYGEAFRPASLLQQLALEGRSF